MLGITLFQPAGKNHLKFLNLIHRAGWDFWQRAKSAEKIGRNRYNKINACADVLILLGNWLRLAVPSLAKVSAVTIIYYAQRHSMAISVGMLARHSAQEGVSAGVGLPKVAHYARHIAHGVSAGMMQPKYAHYARYRAQGVSAG